MKYFLCWHIFFKSLYRFALCGPPSVGRLLADWIAGLVAGTFFLPFYCSESFIGPLCADRFMVQNPYPYRAALFLFDFSQSLGYAPAQFDRAVAFSAYNHYDIPFGGRDSLERL